MWRGKGPRIANLVLKEKNKVEELTLSSIKTYNKAIEIKTVWYWWQNSKIDQGNEIDNLEIDLHSQQILDKGAKAIQWISDNLSTNGALLLAMVQLCQDITKASPRDCVVEAQRQRFCKQGNKAWETRKQDREAARRNTCTRRCQRQAKQWNYGWRRRAGARLQGGRGAGRGDPEGLEPPRTSLLCLPKMRVPARSISQSCVCSRQSCRMR